MRRGPLPFLRTGFRCTLVVAVAGAAWAVWPVSLGAAGPAVKLLLRVDYIALAALAVANIAYAVAGSRRCLSAGA